MSVSQLRSLPRGDDRINSALPLICVSHIWHGPQHPDPYADNLLVLAEAVVKARAAERFPLGNFGLFLDWASLHQRGTNGERTPAERAAFSFALTKMNLWFAHMKTLVYLLTATPPEWPATTTPYDERGWPSFERMIAMLLKHQSSKCWATICDVGAFGQGGLGRTLVYPPQPPTEFAALLAKLTFTNGADRQMVLTLYESTLHTALGQAHSLRYVGLRWGDAEMATLAQVLPLCRNLRYLNLKGSHNAYTASSAALLADVLSRDDMVLMPKLRMIGAGCRDEAQGESDQGPLLEDEQLQAVCAARDIKLLRDVPYELVRQSIHPGPMVADRATRWLQEQPLMKVPSKRRSSVWLSMKSVIRYGERLSHDTL